ncbi:unnamed protein product [Parajaminaea phylloscopi]
MHARASMHRPSQCPLEGPGKHVATAGGGEGSERGNIPSCHDERGPTEDTSELGSVCITYSRSAQCVERPSP